MPHVEASTHDFTHWPLTQDFPISHSLPNLQVLTGFVQMPPAHWSPFAQSVAVVQAHGPPVHTGLASGPASGVGVPVTHLFAVQTLPAPQSAVVVHSFVVPASPVGAVQTPTLQTVPRSHWSFVEHAFTQPDSVQTEPELQLALLVQGVDGGGVTFVQP